MIIILRQFSFNHKNKNKNKVCCLDKERIHFRVTCLETDQYSWPQL